MRRSALVATLVAAAVVASLAATIPGAFARPQATKKPPLQQMLRSGDTVTGVVGGGCMAAAKGDVCAFTASIFPRLRGGLQPEQMGISGGLVEHPDCVGDENSPDASAGVLCIYPVEDELVNLDKNGEGSYSCQAYPVHSGRYGFKVVCNAAAAGSSQAYFIWSYQQA